MDRSPPLDLLKTLGDNTRYAIYLELARSPRPITTAEVASSLSLHANTVRPHLERMRDVGLVDVAVGGRGDVGRPQHRYSLAPGAPSLGLEPPTVPLLARMVLAMAKRLDASDADAEAVGIEEGRARAKLANSELSSLEALVNDLDRLGFDPIVTDDPRSEVIDDARAVISFGNCPFSDLAREHPDLVCGLHKGMVDGFVGDFGDADVEEFCTLVNRTPCRVTVSAR